MMDKVLPCQPLANFNSLHCMANENSLASIQGRKILDLCMTSKDQQQ